MTKRLFYTSLGAAFGLLLLTAALAADPAPRTVSITANDQMRYSVTEITAKRGETLRVVLSSRGTMPKMAMSHNFVLLAKGTNVDAFANASAVAQASGYIAPAFAPKVLASTKLAGNCDTVQVTFDAPKTPGRYDYVCSFPGHALGGMRGVLIVK